MTDVTPITPTHVCASCKATISTLDVYAGHADSCMQPEIRMRRLEVRVETIYQTMMMIHENVALLASLTVSKENHGISEEPATQRTGEPLTELCWHCDESFPAGTHSHPLPKDRGCAPADASAAEPARQEAAGPESAGTEPERSG